MFKLFLMGLTYVHDFVLLVNDMLLKSILAYAHTIWDAFVQMFNIFKRIIMFGLLKVAPVNCY